MIRLSELLESRGLLHQGQKVKLIRHQSPKLDLYQFMLEGQLEYYQRFQNRPVFNCDRIVSFIGLPRSQARLVGVFDIGDYQNADDVETPEYRYRNEHVQPGERFYDLPRVAGFEDLEQRVVVDWATARAWHQWYEHNDKEVLEILPQGYTRPWRGYLDFVLSFQELRRLIANPDANREWHTRLSSVGAIYLIGMDDKLYVGSAGGPGGLLARWTQYAQSGGHGGNTLLRSALTEQPLVANRMQFSILQTLSPGLPLREMVEIEALCKRKLGSRAFGLNAN